MLWSIHSGLSEQEGSVSGPISLLCLLLRLSIGSWSGADPYRNNTSHLPIHIHLIFSLIWTRATSCGSFKGLLGLEYRRRILQFSVLLIFSSGKYWQSLSSLSYLSPSESGVACQIIRNGTEKNTTDEMKIMS